jgi:hypothetical protein
MRRRRDISIIRGVLEKIIRAAERNGEDGRGCDGLVGYLRRLAIRSPYAFAMRMRRVLLLAPKMPIMPASPETLEEYLERRRQEGLPEDIIVELEQEIRSDLRKAKKTDAIPMRERGQRQQPPGNLVEAFILAATQVGEDGHGRGGIDGYFLRLLKKCPAGFLLLLDPAIESDVTTSVDWKNKPYPTLDEVEAEMRKRGIRPSKAFARFYGPMYPQHKPPRIIDATIGKRRF